MRKMSMRKMAEISNVRYQTLQRDVHLLLKMIGDKNLESTIRRLKS